MQKVVGSSPIIRFRQTPWKSGGFCSRSVLLVLGSEEGWERAAGLVGGVEVAEVGEEAAVL